jgi:hypothetical protein
MSDICKISCEKPMEEKLKEGDEVMYDPNKMKNFPPQAIGLLTLVKNELIVTNIDERGIVSVGAMDSETGEFTNLPIKASSSCFIKR